MGIELNMEVVVESPVCVQPIVKPGEEERDEILFLSNIDQTVMYTVETVHMYRASGPMEGVAQKIKEGLRKLLVPYYFMAGRMRFNPEQQRMEIHCNGAGALFVEAKCDTHSVEDLVLAGADCPEYKKLVYQLPPGLEMHEAPTLIIQVTVFKCGGFVVGLANSHTLLDGLAAAEFMANLATLVSQNGGELAVPPLPDRTCFNARNPPQVKYPHSEFINLSELLKLSSSSFTHMDHPKPDVTKDHLCAPEEHIFRSFPVSINMVNCLKKRIQSMATDLPKCGAFDAISAHMWQCRTKALAESLDPNEESFIFYAVDLRNRYNPPLPVGFAGNAIFSAHAKASVAEVLNSPLYELVNKIRDGVNQVTQDYVQSAIDNGEINRAVPNITSKSSLFLSAWWKLPFNKADFGMGSHAFSGPVINNRVEFVLLLSNNSSDKAATNPDQTLCTVYLALEPKQMSKFEELFLDF